MKLNILPARAGLQWVRLGIRTFFRQPLAQGALFILFIAVPSFITQVPFVGGIVALTLMPALTVGLMAAAREADGGKIPLPAILFIAFRQGAARARAMIALGLLYAAAMTLTAVITALIGGEHFVTLVLGNTHIATPEQLVTLLDDRRVQIAPLVFMALSTGVSLTFWYAPALVHWHGIAPVKSLFFSCVAVLKNTRPFLFYGLAWLCLALGAILVLLLLAAQMGSVSASVTVIAIGLLPVLLILGALFSASRWFTFRDIYATDEPLALPNHLGL